MEETDLRTAEELYRALHQQDVPLLRRLLDRNCEGEFTAGLPAGIGGLHDGAGAILAAWRTVARLYDVRPEPDEILPAGDGRVVVLGHYRGQARESGRTLDAAFVHVLRIEDGRVRGLVQVTDSQRWREALEPAAPT